MDNKTKEALKQLQAEIRQLQTALAGHEPSPHDTTGQEAGGPQEMAVQYRVQAAVNGPATELQKTVFTWTHGQLARVPDEAASALGYALASAQKIALLRALLGKDSESAARLGELSGLSTGSLYHHLRELMRASLVRQGGRNQYILTERGQRVLLVVLALAAEDAPHV